MFTILIYNDVEFYHYLCDLLKSDIFVVLIHKMQEKQELLIVKILLLLTISYNLSFKYSFSCKLVSRI